MSEASITGTTAAKSVTVSAECPASLRVAIEDAVVSHALPTSGEVCLGRSSEAHVTLAHPSISRRHAMLKLGSPIQLCDLGSSNGTKVRGRRLEANAWVEIARGEVFTLGDVPVLIHDGLVQHAARQSLGDGAVRRSIERNIEVHERTGARFSVCVVRCVTTRKWADVLSGMLLTRDHVAMISDSVVVMVLAERAPQVADQLVNDLVAHLRRLGARPEVQLSSCPRDGVTVDRLLPTGLGPAPAKPDTLRPAAPVAENRAMRKLFDLVAEVADSPTSILLLGETGVGKEVVARALHEGSSRRGAPFMAINCAAIEENLLESELFGYEKGAFTGAVAAKLGLLEAAQGGTVFLDELGEMPRATQAKLLRVLEERMVRRVGAVKPRPIDIRVIAATNRNLQDEIAAGRFRADLFYRVNGLTIDIPPLRDRKDDIGALATAFRTTAAAALRRQVPVLAPEALALLVAWDWPGNIRELRNVVERAVLLAKSGVIGPAELPEEMQRAAERQVGSLHDPMPTVASDVDPPRTVRAHTAGGGKRLTEEMDRLAEEMGRVERERIIDALAKCNGNQTQAAVLLGITRRMLIGRLQRYGISRPRAAADKGER